jgi:hypothetical protein
MRALVLVMVAGTGLLGLSGCADANSYRANAYRPPGPTTTTTTIVVRDANGMPLSTAEAVRDANGNPVNPPGSATIRVALAMCRKLTLATRAPGSRLCGDDNLWDANHRVGLPFSSPMRIFESVAGYTDIFALKANNDRPNRPYTRRDPLGSRSRHDRI